MLKDAQGRFQAAEQMVQELQSKLEEERSERQNLEAQLSQKVQENLSMSSDLEELRSIVQELKDHSRRSPSMSEHDPASTPRSVSGDVSRAGNADSVCTALSEELASLSSFSS